MAPRSKGSTYKYDVALEVEGSAEFSFLGMNAFIILAFRILRILSRSCVLGFSSLATMTGSGVETGLSFGCSVF